MPCPCFEPTDPLPWSTWPGRYRPPLGRPYAGLCRARPGEAHQPADELVIGGCNMGYARTRCPRVPEAAADAVRFSLTAEGAVRWVVERDHMPVDYGTVLPSSLDDPDTVIGRQIEAYRNACSEESGAPGSEDGK